MAKDPAFLFYHHDFLVGTSFMTNTEVGCYIRILCHMADKGHLSENHMIIICGDKALFTTTLRDKFLVDFNGLYFNQRLDEEIDKRREYCKSRGYNKLGHFKNKNHMKIISKSYDNHMVNENIDENGVTTNQNTTIKNINIIKIKKFVPPIIEEVQAYCLNRKNNVDADLWHSYYSANGWKVGKNPMKDWRAAVRTWERNSYTKPIDQPKKRVGKDPVLSKMDEWEKQKERFGGSNG